MGAEENHKETCQHGQNLTGHLALAEYEVEMLQLFVMCSVINKHGDMQELQKQKDVK
jgi:hypothetical protein